MKRKIPKSFAVGLRMQSNFINGLPTE
jgi:hypothetical protein